MKRSAWRRPSPQPGYDWFYPYDRDRALCLALGATAYDTPLQAVGFGAPQADAVALEPSSPEYRDRFFAVEFDVFELWR